MRDLENLDRLEQYLKDHGIQYERKDWEGNSYFDRHQICVPCCGEGREWDVICNAGSYGSEEGLLELMGSLVSPNAGDVVEGYLTAEDIIERIEAAAGGK